MYHPTPVAEGPRETLEAIEADLRTLMRKCAELEHSASKSERDSRRKQDVLFISLIEVLDSFERVFANIREYKESLDQRTKAWVGNFRTTYRLLKQVLTDHGLVEIESADRMFDPHWHKGVKAVEGSGLPPGTILEVLRKGYMIGNRCLRKMEVVFEREQGDE